MDNRYLLMFLRVYYLVITLFHGKSWRRRNIQLQEPPEAQACEF